MRWLIKLVACISFIACVGASADSGRKVVHVLFVGNSLTYVGNLPAVFDAVSLENHRPTASDMLTSGGATLTDWVNDGLVARALDSRKYSYVVLQERGYDFACGFGPEVCANSRKSLASLVELVRRHNATPVLMGTYQGDAPGSRRIVEAEALAAKTSGIGYVSVSDHLQTLRMAHPDMAWLASDGMHPGSDLTLLEALLLFKHLNGVTSSRVNLSIEAPIYTYKSGPLPEVRSAEAPSDMTGIPSSIEYKSSEVALLLESP